MYERYGFTTVGTYMVRRIGYVESFMVRAPKGGGRGGGKWGGGKWGGKDG